MKYVIGGMLILGGIALAIWLSIWVMLYGGIVAAIDNYDVSTGATVWGVIRAIFFEVGLIPGFVVMAIGTAICGDD